MVESLKVVAVEGQAEVSFWERLAELKLNKFKLNDDQVPIRGWINFSHGNAARIVLQLRTDSFECHAAVASESNDVDEITSNNSVFTKNAFEFKGTLLNTNTAEDFKKLDKKHFLKKAGQRIVDSLENQSIFDDPASIFTFTLITFADLKKHRYVYWYAFPTIVDKSLAFTLAKDPVNLDALFNERLQKSLFNQVQELGKYIQDYMLFLILISDEDITLLPLKQWKQLSADDRDNVHFGFFDPSIDNSHPSWIIRNFLFLIKRYLRRTTLLEDIVCLRDTLENSRILSVGFKNTNSDPEVEFVGWELNAKGKAGPKLLDLNSHLNPEAIAANALDLNLRLMTWRQFPALKLDEIKETKVTLFGAGTLGCSVARCLIGWGFKNIDFIDNGTVSHSNPVRQSLFTLEDLNKSKAEVAAEKLMKIAPGVKATGFNLTIPMPGHFLDVTRRKDVEETITTLLKLNEVVKESDVIFLLTDTRESRWLPTLLATMHDKIAINCALGFDSFLVMRHGYGLESKHAISEGYRLGCYFCNDVVAPQNSMIDRTLDQQCTVTRPGLAPVSAGLAVELLVSILHHPLNFGAPSPRVAENQDVTPLPHQIRGFLSSFETIKLEAPAFENCTACSKKVVDVMKECFQNLSIQTELGPEHDIIKIFNHADYLEVLSGLFEMKVGIDDIDNDLILDESDFE